MKYFVKALSLTLVVLFLLSCVVSCGGGEKESVSETVETQTETEKETQKLDAFGRDWIEDSVPVDTNYSSVDNNTVTFFVREIEVYMTEIDVDEITDDTFCDAVYFRNKTVEERLGVTIDYISQVAGSADERTAWFQTVRNAVNTKSNDFDCASIYASQGSPLALEGCFYNLLTVDALDLEKPWWNQDMIEGLDIFDTLFFLGGDLMISQTKLSAIMVYNKEIFEKYYPSYDVYKSVTDYKWTVDELYSLTAPVWEDVNASGILDDGDIVGYTGYGSSSGTGYNDMWQAAMDIQIVTKSAEGIPELTLYSEHTVNAFEKLANLHMNNPGGMAGATTNTTFALGNVLFATSLLSNCELYRDMGDKYGVIPLPMCDTEQGKYRTYPHNSCSLLTILASVDGERLNMIGHTLELMAAESYRQVIPKYYEVCLKNKYSADVSDAMMYDLILESISFDFGFVYGTESIGGVNKLFRNFSIDIAQKYESSKTSYESALESLIDKLDEISMTSGK